MKCFKALFDFYLNASIHVALAAFSFVFITAFEFNFEVPISLIFFIVFATIFGYNFVKYYGVSKSHFHKFTRRLLLIRILMTFSLVGVVYFSFFLELKTLFFSAFLAAITLFYAMPFVPKILLNIPVSNLRTIAGIKVYIIALVWVGATVVMPLIEMDIDWENHMLITVVQRFIMVVILMLPFEIRDLQYDSLKLETIPQKIGIKTTKVLGFALIAIVATLEFLKGYALNSFSIVLLLILCLTALLLHFANVNNNRYYTIFWVESVPIIWCLLLLF